MTSDELMKGIDAVRNINDINIDLMKNDNNITYCKSIEKNLSVITDVLQEVFNDMVEIDAIKSKITIMNNTLEQHLSRFQ